MSCGVNYEFFKKICISVIYGLAPIILAATVTMHTWIYGCTYLHTWVLALWAYPIDNGSRSVHRHMTRFKLIKINSQSKPQNKQRIRGGKAKKATCETVGVNIRRLTEKANSTVMREPYRTPRTHSKFASSRRITKKSTERVATDAMCIHIYVNAYVHMLVHGQTKNKIIEDYAGRMWKKISKPKRQESCFCKSKK